MQANQSDNLSEQLVVQATHEESVIVRNPEGELAQSDWIAEEVAVALVYNGISHAVMMLTPQDLADFAMGFSLTEGILTSTKQLRSLELVESELGIEVRMEIATEAFVNLKQRRRQLSGRTGCGICGLESLTAVQPDVAIRDAHPMPSYQLIEKAAAKLKGSQQIQSQCGAVHAAALFDDNAELVSIREDVGRHNALDKLLGAIALNKQEDKLAGFVLVSSRASFEMVSKAAKCGIHTLVAVSAPTKMAITLAKQANMNLIGFVRPQRQVVYVQAVDA
ncbi:formate dehydrogenase [Marinomonas sp. S3726]|uniref:formate dehydrogenase accessory sulfurtransferase FdhD n=1 Tax=Marinomonas sp. S3726 TaxID=579484 RepID=UPI00061E0B51|nr:formate dehydrogenase accessory sulfurtransferase FdhD [Marinomonas sp. S3726]KJZ15218.1 formate dehydrogenase [Marinomonas sp. S3726]